MSAAARTQRVVRALTTRQRLLDARVHQLTRALHDAEDALTEAREDVTAHSRQAPAADVGALRTWNLIGTAKAHAVSDHENLLDLARTDLDAARQDALAAAVQVAALERVANRHHQDRLDRQAAEAAAVIDDHVSASHARPHP